MGLTHRVYRIEIRTCADEDPDDAMRQAAELLSQQIDPEGQHVLQIEVHGKPSNASLFSYYYHPLG